MNHTTDEIEAGWLTLRPFHVDDVPWVYEVSQDALIRHFNGLPEPYEMEHARFFVQEVAMANADRIEYVILDALSRERLGRVGLGLGRDGTGEIGYWAAPEARGKGVTTHAVKALCRWAFRSLDLELIQWRAEAGNEASRRVAEKAGFVFEGTLRRRLVRRGTRLDLWVGSLLEEELMTTIPGRP
ncbi:GNAT family N-acetyltransferase [Nonomuraea insulae]|uniref:GNAT family N-acetyltransferase n=1 Tax=Nonomuraea insulae TaxID=1616787 RepID=A0ABW1CBT3_9ACTN